MIPGRFELLLLVITLLLIPNWAMAWGPVVHLEAAEAVLSGAIAISPALLRLLTTHAKDFMYGTLAADFVIGKKHAKHHDHCHNWDVARALLRDAREHGAHREAFMYGYINHLGADVVAHNHIVPEMLIFHFAAKGVGHIYWEARSDQRILSVKPHLKTVWEELSLCRFPGHDRFLENRVVPTLFSNKISSGIYRGNLFLQQKGMWRQMFQRIDERSKLAFGIKTLLRWTALAAQSGARAIENPWSKRLDHLDPIGREALAWAERKRKRLRAELKSKGETTALDVMFSQAMAKSSTIDICHFEDD